jgi:3-phosphoshikimate 1-carboxyvinyltransferase
LIKGKTIVQWIVKKSLLAGDIVIPPSKSHTIRALLIATLAHGTSTIIRPLMTGDGGSAIGAAKAMGATVTHVGDTLNIMGIGGNYNRGEPDFDMGNSGTSTNLFSTAAALGSKPRRIDGDNSLRSRPVRPLLTALQRLGVTCIYETEGRDLPFTIQGPLSGGATTVDGISSQFVSSLLLSCPLAPNDTDIQVVNLHEKPYIDITLWWLDKLGVRYTKSNDYMRFHIAGKQRYSAISMAIPADFSSATFSAVAASATRSKLSIRGIDFTDPQGDKGIFDILSAMGVSVIKEKSGVEVDGTAGCTGRVIDLNAMPDALPAFAVLACAAEGTTTIVNVAQARIKETDRITVMAQELSRMGARITEKKDGLVIEKSALRGCRVNGHDDHRVVMALAIAGMIAEGETIIDTAESAGVTYPSFREDFCSLGARIEKGK